MCRQIFMSFCVFCAQAFLGLCSWAANLTPVLIRVWASVCMGVSPRERLAISGADDDGAVDFCVWYVFDRSRMWAAGKALGPACALSAHSIGKWKLNRFFYFPICLSQKSPSLFCQQNLALVVPCREVI